MEPLLYLSRADVERVGLDMPAAIALLERAFREKAAGRVEMPPKPGIHPRPDAFIHAMPAYVGAMQAAGIKWIGAFPGNAARGLPYISGLLVLNDDATGLPVCIMDCGWITGCRTAAASALAARHLARPESSTLGVIGCGLQARTHVEAMWAEFPLRRVMAYDHRQSNAERFADEMRSRHGVEVIIAVTPRDAVAGCDLVVTAAPIRKDPAPPIEAGWLAPGAFAAAIDFDSSWSGAALTQVDHLSTDDRAQLTYYRSVGYFATTPEPHSELAHLVSGGVQGRTHPGQRTMAMHLGLAMEDIVVGAEVRRRAIAAGIGMPLER